MVLTGFGIKGYASEHGGLTAADAWLWTGALNEGYYVDEEDDEYKLEDIAGWKFAGIQETGPHVSKGSCRWFLMGWAKWNRVYYRSTPDGNLGVVMLLVQKAGKGCGDTTWTAVDPVGRVQMIDLRDRRRVSTRPADGLSWTDHPGLSPSRQEEAVMASERLIAKAHMEKANPSKKKANLNANKTKAKKGNNRTAAVWWFFQNMTSAGVWAWTRRTYGGSAAAAFLGWRVWRILGLGMWFTWGKDIMDGVYEQYESVAESYETVKDMTESAVGRVGADRRLEHHHLPLLLLEERAG